MKTKEQIKREILNMFPDMKERIADAHATLALTFEELEAELKRRYPNTPEEEIYGYISDEVTLAESEISTALFP